MWLYQVNIVQHCQVRRARAYPRTCADARRQILTVGDCAVDETRAFSSGLILPRVPERSCTRGCLSSGTRGASGGQCAADAPCSRLYRAFGGKLAYWGLSPPPARG
jgi:hypothetical protein